MPTKKQKSKSKLKPFFALVRRTNPSYGKLAFALALSVVTTLVSLLIPLLTKQLVDGFSMSNLSGTQIGLIALVFFVQAGLSAYATYALNYNGQKIISGLRELLWKKLIKLPVSYFDTNASGETVSRVTNDTMVVKELITTHISGFITGIISVIGSIIDNLVYYELEADTACVSGRSAGRSYFGADWTENVLHFTGNAR